MTKRRAALLSGTLLAPKGSAAPAPGVEPAAVAAQDDTEVIEPTEIVKPAEALPDGATLDPNLLNVDAVDIDGPPFKGSGNLPVRTTGWRSADPLVTEIDPDQGQKRRTWRYAVAAVVIGVAALAGWSAKGLRSDSEETAARSVLPPAAAAPIPVLRLERTLPARASVVPAALPEPLPTDAPVADTGQQLENRPLAEFDVTDQPLAGLEVERVPISRDIERPIAPLSVALVEVAPLGDPPEPAAVEAALRAPPPPLAVLSPGDPSPVPLRKPDAPSETAVAALQIGLYVQLGSVRTSAGAEREWRRLVKDFPAVLAGMDLRVERASVPNRGAFYRIRTGPISSLIQARAICAEFAARNRGCLVIRK